MPRKTLKYIEIMDPDQIWKYLEDGKDMVFFDLNNFKRSQWVSSMDVNVLRDRISLFKNANQDNSKHFFLEAVEDE